MRTFRSTFILTFLLYHSLFAFAQSNVTASIDAAALTASMSNGLVSITINNKGQVASLTSNNRDLIEYSSGGRFYFSLNDQVGYKELAPTSVRMVKQTSDYAEVVYSNPTGGLMLEQGFILRKNVSGLYCYVTVKGTATSTTLREMRVVYRVSPNQFTYGYVDDSMQGMLPSVADMIAVNDTPVMDATYQLPNGTIYTKYDWTNYIVQDSVHGIMSENAGVWAIPVSHEYVNGGPMKQELTVHATNKTPLVLQMLQGEHLGAASQVYGAADAKIYGPFFIYVNSGASRQAMIEDAKKQVSVQQAQWPFDWFSHVLYPTSRSTVTGRMKLPEGVSADGIQVVLAKPGIDVYAQGKDYLFWSKTDSTGAFTIDHVRKGSYTLYAWATKGDITDECSVNNISVSDSVTNLTNIFWRPARYENKLFQIGESDRLSGGFRYSDTLRRYGLYDLPPADLNFTVGTSQPAKNWYYAQTKAGSWTITFNNDKNLSGNAYLTASIAGCGNSPTVDVYVNGSKKTSWAFSNDGSVYRSAVLSGKHLTKSLTFPASALIKGTNTVKLTLSNPGNRGGVMYDCVKLEAGSLVTGLEEPHSDRADQFTVTNYPNPFASETTFQLELGREDRVVLEIFNLQGQLVETLHQGILSAGTHTFEWKPGNRASGLYFYRVRLQGKMATGKVLYVRNPAR